MRNPVSVGEPRDILSELGARRCDKLSKLPLTGYCDCTTLASAVIPPNLVPTWAVGEDASQIRQGDESSHVTGNSCGPSTQESRRLPLKTTQILGVLFLLALSTAAAAQSSSFTLTEVVDASAISSTPFAGCNGDMNTLGGSFTETTTQWVDGAGDTHTRSQVISSDLTAISASIEYKVLFSQKLVEAVSDGITQEETLTFRLKLLGPGPLNNQMMFTEIHFTNPSGIGNGNNTNHIWSKCTG